MTKSETKLLVGIGVLILLIDIFLLKIWVADIEPNLFMSNGIAFPRFKSIGINLLITIVLYFIKKRYSILFLINAIVCPLLFTFFWNSWIENHPYSETNYHFKIQDRNLRLNISENPNTYEIYELDPNPTDSLKIIEIGMNKKIGDSILLEGWDKGEFFDMYFYNNNLIGLPESPNPIKLNKKE